MPNVFIFGSCVSRDTCPFLGDEWVITDYVARQGFISAATGPTDFTGESTLTSPFQNRCLRNDIAGSFLPTLKAKADETDLILIDLVEERLGVYQTKDGGYLTHTWELEESGLLDGRLESLTHIPFGTDGHFNLWARAADKVTARINRLGIPAIVLAPAWAAKADNGGGGFDYQKIPADVWNAAYERYFEHLESLGMTVIRLAPDTVRSSVSHQWGLAPYHYMNRVYEAMQKEVKRHFAMAGGAVKAETPGVEAV
jgi:hypothetical protein